MPRVPTVHSEAGELARTADAVEIVRFVPISSGRAGGRMAENPAPGSLADRCGSPFRRWVDLSEEGSRSFGDDFLAPANLLLAALEIVANDLFHVIHVV